VVPPGERRFEIATAESLLTVAVRRGGPLARLGHNHIIAMRDLRGEVRMGADLATATFQWTQPVDRMTVDEVSLRAAAGADFSAPVPDDARAGTRTNMLGPALLDAAQFPDLRVSGRVLRLTGPYTALLEVEVLLRGRRARLELPVHFAWRDAATLGLDGEFELRQTQLGLTPFSVMMGALQVEDLMQLRFSIVGRAITELPR
jgi:hypothetical protein